MLTRKGIKSGNGWLNEIVNVSMLGPVQSGENANFLP
jgi:hypothetical protein